MLDKIRFSTSFIIALIFTFMCFIGMSLLIKSPTYQKHNQIEMVSFSKVNDMKSPDITKKPKAFEKPLRKVVKQPPAAPKLDITANPNREAVPMPKGLAKIDPADLTRINLPALTKLGHDDVYLDNNKDLVQLFAIQPIYPPMAARNKTEGWVKVEFIVNEFGKVTRAKVIDAKPRSIFNTATLKAIYKSKFKPLIVDGIPVAQTATQTFEFKLEQ
ncbi:MAG: energy transducer TonB [Alcanivoracaceae bacterium]|nr:energy transducer TonB [Alcanivoracaceae bacterium]